MLPTVPLLSLPASAAVYLIYSSQHKGNISSLIGIGIPLAFNLVGGYFLVIFLQARDIQSSISKSIHYHDVNIEIKSETITPWRPNTSYNTTYPYAYQAVLHVNNSLQEEIPAVIFSLGAYNNWTFETDLYDPKRISVEYYNDNIPQGDSDIVIDMPIVKSMFYCNNANFAKPLYLLYSIDGGMPSRIAISNSINQELRRIACGSTP